MAFLHSSLLVLVLCFLAHSSTILAQTPTTPVVIPLNRHNFSKEFIFGTACSAYQVEGAVFEDGRAPSIWDNFTHEYKNRIDDGSNGDIAIDFYHRYEEDIQRNKDMKMDAFRFSFSWSRILPRGNTSLINHKGIDFYKRVIKSIKDKGMEPFVTLFHWDVPQALEELYGGFRDERIIKDFANYAELCFKFFGKDVKYWITLNEPVIFTVRGYDTGAFAPGRCSKFMEWKCKEGDSATEPYNVTHNLLRAHAEAARIYKRKYEPLYNGKIGPTFVTMWMEPDNPRNSDDVAAAKRALDWMFGWYIHPLVYGHYPDSMVERVGSRLPKFTNEESASLMASYDFIGLNYYTATYVKNDTKPPVNIGYSTDAGTILNNTNSVTGKPIGEQVGSEWLRVYEKGLENLLLHVKNNYKNPVIYITENGVDEMNNRTVAGGGLKDPKRIEYYNRHLLKVHEAIYKGGVNVQGYFAWSLLDNFEWAQGYTSRFGLYFVDYKDNLKRYAKDSVAWITKFLT